MAKHPIVSMLYLSVLLNYNQPLLGLRDRCVVIGNAPIDESRALGAIIDEHDAVIRINDAVVEGFERYRGAKSTHRVMLNEYDSLASLQHVVNAHKTDEQLLYVVRNTKDILWLYILLHHGGVLPHLKETVKPLYGDQYVHSPRNQVWAVS